MRPATLATAALLALCDALPATAQGLPPGAGPVQVGAVTGDPEKDSVGYALPAGTTPSACAGASRFTADAVPVGMATGDPEKDTIGFLLLADAAGGCGAAE